MLGRGHPHALGARRQGRRLPARRRRGGSEFSVERLRAERVGQRGDGGKLLRHGLGCRRQPLRHLVIEIDLEMHRRLLVLRIRGHPRAVKQPRRASFGARNRPPALKPPARRSARALWTACHARAEDASLVTHDTREFERVAGLRVEEWVGACDGRPIRVGGGVAYSSAPLAGATAIVVRAERLLVGLLRPSILLGCMRRGWPLTGILNSP